jgi:predicted nucleic acid-binding protein
MAAVLLDTTVVIDLLRGRSGAARRLRGVREAGDAPYVCAINIEEVARGLRRSAEEDDAQRLFAGLRIVELGEPEGWQAGVWRGECASRGVSLSQADCLVAAAAHSVGGRLATGNPRDFPMDELDVEHWPAGE